MKYLYITFLLAFPLCSYAIESSCYGTTSNGRLENGVKLPSSGKNYTGYSFIAETAGRTYVHSKVKDVLLAAYKYLETDQPTKVYKYAETGYKEGGQFKPHKTHRNRLSVDFMTPVIDSNGMSVHLPTHPFNKFGYSIEFNKSDEYGDYIKRHITLSKKRSWVRHDEHYHVDFEVQCK